MLIDTHCHLDMSAFDTDRRQVIERALAVGVQAIVIPAVEACSWARTIECAYSFAGGYYALGIHPMFVPQASEADLAKLEALLSRQLDDPRLVAVGEIGLDFFIPELRTTEMKAKQIKFYTAQLRLAQRLGLPVLLHVRRSQDLILKYLRRYPQVKGIAHAFNGSFQQAERFLAAGFALGFGGAMTFTRAKQIRRLATQLPLEAIVLETDAPDIPPAWLTAHEGQAPRNEPCHVAGCAQLLAQLRSAPLPQVESQTTRNALQVLPRLAAHLKLTH